VIIIDQELILFDFFASLLQPPIRFRKEHLAGMELLFEIFKALGVWAHTSDRQLPLLISYLDCLFC